MVLDPNLKVAEFQAQHFPGSHSPHPTPGESKMRAAALETNRKLTSWSRQHSCN